jgi:hypothetical protein
LSLLLAVAGCSSPPPADQFKPISDGKKAALTGFLESKQSELWDYKATVTEESNIDKRGERTHIGVIEFIYPVTKPEGESKSQTLNTATAEYHFSTKEKKWVYKGCVLKQGGGASEPKEGLLVTFPEVKAAFEK